MIDRDSALNRTARDADDHIDVDRMRARGAPRLGGCRVGVKSALGIGIAAAAVTSAAVAGAASGHVRQRVVATLTSLTPFGVGDNSDSVTEFGNVSGVGSTRPDRSSHTADSTRPEDTRPRADPSVAGPSNGIEGVTPASDVVPGSVPSTDPSAPPSTTTSSGDTSSTSTSTSSSSSSSDGPTGIGIASDQPGGSNVPTSVPHGRP